MRGPELIAVTHPHEDHIGWLHLFPEAPVVAHRLVYRAHVQLPFAQVVERRTAVLRLDRLVRHGLVIPADGGCLAV